MKPYINPRTLRWKAQQVAKSRHFGKPLDRHGRVRTPKRVAP